MTDSGGELKYTEKTSLACRGPVEGRGPAPVQGILLVADKKVGSWVEEGQAGCDLADLFPAVHHGERAWLLRLRREWQPGRGYCAWGTEELIISFSQGVELVLKHGLLDALWPNDVTRGR